MGYAELHCHSNASFLDGASPPEELVSEAVRLGLEALALTDRDGMYGVVRFAEAARALGLPTVFGAELTLGLGSASGAKRSRGVVPDPPGEHLVVLARDPNGYARLCRAISTAQRAGHKQAVRMLRYPGAVERAAEIGRALAFDLELIAPRLPDFPVPPGHTEMSWLRRLAEEGATRRYGRRGAERVAGAWRQIDYELDMIEQLGFPGYFLTVWDIVQFCGRAGIYCQGRGSAANSAA